MPSGDMTWLRRELDANFPTMTLGKVTFWINPERYSDPANALVPTEPTLAGLIRWDFGAGPRIYRVQGTTGNSFYEGPGGMRDLEQFKPKPGRTDDLYPWRFPWAWPGVRWVRVNTFEHSGDATQTPWYHWYDLQLQEDPPELAIAAVRVTGGAPGFEIPLPAGG